VKYYLSVDIGASSGRHILGCARNGRIFWEEIYRFENGASPQNGRLCWDTDRLFQEIVRGMARCAETGKIPASMGIDTWGVDFVLLDENLNRIGDAVAYRDSRTAGVDREVEKRISAGELYARTGIQKQSFNTLYQLVSILLSHPEDLKRARHFLMIPEYFNFLLTGVLKNEYTNSTTTQLVNARTKTWDFELIRRLGLPTGIFGKIEPPGTPVGHLRPEIARRAGFDCEVVLPATHDTGSAVMAVPAQKGEDCIFLSSGTWSLMGVERGGPDCSEQSRACNFTNEGGYRYRYRFLKNIMGLWIIQSARKELDRRYTFDELCDLAKRCDSFPSRIDVNDGAFLAPASMTEAIRAFCRGSGQKVPGTTGELFSCIYHSLAESYAATAGEIERVTGKRYPVVRVVGGGCKDEYINELTAKTTGKTVLAGPVEATAMGNLMAQMLKAGEFRDLDDARGAVAKSIQIKQFGSVSEC